MRLLCVLVIGCVLIAPQSQTNAADPPPVNDADWSRAINLMPLIDTQKDAVSGTWVLEGGKLKSDSSRQARLQITYEPPRDYGFRIVFNCSGGIPTVGQYVSRGRSSAALWIMGAAGNSQFAFLTGSKNIVNNLNKKDAKGCLEIGRDHTSVVQVHWKGATAYLDGKLITRWAAESSDTTLGRPWNMPDQRLLGIATDGTTVTFSKIELLEISGKGKLKRQESRK